MFAILSSPCHLIFKFLMFAFEINAEKPLLIKKKLHAEKPVEARKAGTLSNDMANKEGCSEKQRYLIFFQILSIFSLSLV